MSNRKGGKYLPLLLAGLIIAFLFTSQPFLHLLPLALMPGPEGVDMYFYGVQFAASTEIYKASSMDPLPDPGDGSEYSWQTTQTHVVTVSKSKAPGEPLGGLYWNGPWWWYDHGEGTFRSEHVRVALMTEDPVGYGSRVTHLEYYVQEWEEGNKVYRKKYVAYVIPADITLELSVSEGWYNWRDMKIWYVLDSVVWINAFTEQQIGDPNPPEDGVLSAYEFRGAFPLIAWVGGYAPWQWHEPEGDLWKSKPPTSAAEKHANLDPSYEGRVIDLYTEPGQKYELVLSADVVSDRDYLQAAVAKGLPDPRFSRNAYFYITVNQLGAYIDPEVRYSLSYTAWHPVVHYRIRTLWCVYGEYIYAWTTEQEQQQQYEFENRTSQQESLWDFWNQFKHMTGIDIKGFMTWAYSPIGMLTLGLVSAAIFILIVVVVLAWSGALTPVLMYLLSRKR